MALNLTDREFAESLRVARGIASFSLGASANMIDPHTDSGIYTGRIIGETKYHSIQRVAPEAAVAHPKHLLNEEPCVGQAVSIRYFNEQGLVRELRQRQRGRDIGR